jgi:hypothetical protein
MTIYTTEVEKAARVARLEREKANIEAERRRAGGGA